MPCLLVSHTVLELCDHTPKWLTQQALSSQSHHFPICEECVVCCRVLLILFCHLLLLVLPCDHCVAGLILHTYVRMCLFMPVSFSVGDTLGKCIRTQCVLSVHVNGLQCGVGWSVGGGSVGWGVGWSGVERVWGGVWGGVGWRECGVECGVEWGGGSMG